MRTAVRSAAVLAAMAGVGAFSPVTWAAQWIDLEATDLKTSGRYYIDRSSTTFEGDLMYVRVKREIRARYGAPDERGFRPCVDPMIVCANAGVTIHNFVIHCKSRTNAETGFTRYDDQGRPTSSQTIPRPQWEFSQPAPDTLGDRIVSLACQRQKAPTSPTTRQKITPG